MDRPRTEVAALTVRDTPPRSVAVVVTMSCLRTAGCSLAQPTTNGAMAPPRRVKHTCRAMDPGRLWRHSLVGAGPFARKAGSGDAGAAVGDGAAPAISRPATKQDDGLASSAP